MAAQPHIHFPGLADVVGDPPYVRAGTIPSNQPFLARLEPGKEQHVFVIVLDVHDALRREHCLFDLTTRHLIPMPEMEDGLGPKLYDCQQVDLVIHFSPPKKGDT